MLETAILITGYIGFTAFAAWVGYLVGHMAGAAEARARLIREHDANAKGRHPQG